MFVSARLLIALVVAATSIDLATSTASSLLDVLLTADTDAAGYWKVTREMGFIAHDRADAFPPSLLPYKEVLEMPTSLHAGGTAADNEAYQVAARALTPIEITREDTPADLEVKFHCLTYVAAKYLLVGKQETGDSVASEDPVLLPRNLAVPLFQLAALLERDPSISYSANVLDNCVFNATLHEARLANPTSYTWPWTVDRSISGLRGESGFMEAHCEVERVAGQGAVAGIALARMIHSIAGGLVDDDPVAVEHHLFVLADTIREMQVPLRSMYRQIAYDDFYPNIRPFFGIYDAARGAAFEGVRHDGSIADESDTEGPWLTRVYPGPSGAMTSSLPFFDALLSVGMTDSDLHALMGTFRRFWPAPHRRLIEAVENGPSIRDYVKSHRDSRPSLVVAYDDALAALSEFRAVHVVHTSTFITKQLPAGVREAFGTGGASFAKVPFTEYLCHHMLDTDEMRLDRLTPSTPIPLACFCCCVDTASSACDSIEIQDSKGRRGRGIADAESSGGMKEEL